MLRLRSISAAALLSVAGMAAAAECEGNACRFVSVQWDQKSGRFRARNSHLNRSIKLETTSAGVRTALIVGPKSSGLLPLATFERPYRANFAR
jgi:hypothetical protein